VIGSAASLLPSARARLALLSGYAVVTFLSFPHPVGDRVVDLGLVLAWIGPALLIRGLAGLAPRRAAKLAFFASLAAHTAILHWIYIVTVVYGKAPAIAGLAGPLGLGVYVATFSAMFGAALAVFTRGRLDSPWLIAASWAAFDHLRSFALSGLPWATLGYAQHQNDALLALAPYTGVYGLSFVTVLAGASLVHLVGNFRAGRGTRPDVWLAVAAVAAVHVAGLTLRDPEGEDDVRRVRVAVLQGNVDQGVKWSESWAERILANYEGLARNAAEQGAEIIVWPETSFPGLLDIDPDLRRRLSDLARETSATHIVGAVGLEFSNAGRKPTYYDSAFVVGPDGVFDSRYDKSHLVPFGEYVPARNLLGYFLRAVARGVAPDNVTPGPGPRSLDLPAGTEGGERVISGVPICYELLFPDLVRRMVDDGAEILFAITNDAWYGRTGAPYQFLAMTAVRSAETRVWTARAANTGVSAIIDSRGRVRARTRIFERDWLMADMPLRAAPLGGSFYARNGDVFAGVCWSASALLGIVAWSRRRETGTGPEPESKDGVGK